MLVDNDAKESTGKAQADNAGKSVNGIDQVLAYEYNVKGEVTEMKRDNNVDGTYDYRERYTLNANGQQTEKSIDLTNDGQFDRKEVYTKEADDGLVKTHFYNIITEDDGSMRDVLTKIEEYTLNANNQRTQVSVDTLGDGSINAITKYDVDAYGRVSKAYFDTNGDDIVDRTETYTRDTNGNILRNEVDTDLDGLADSVRTYVRNALGQAIEYEIDNGNDGIIDTRYEYVRDVYGNEQAYTLYSYDSTTQNLELSVQAEHTFNELNQTESVTYSYPDSSRDYSVAYTYNEYGQKISDEFTGARNARWDYVYNDDGTVYSRSDYNAERAYTGKTVYSEYYPEFNLSKVLESYNAEDQLTAITQFIRTNSGEQIASLIDMASTNGTGSWDRFAFGDRGANSSYNTSLDFTTYSEEKLAELGTSLSRIYMANGAVSELTINAEVIAKISEGGLQVRGAADKNDVLNLSSFEKSATSNVRGYDLYTASVDGEDLNLYVQANDSITVNIIG